MTRTPVIATTKTAVIMEQSRARHHLLHAFSEGRSHLKLCHRVQHIPKKKNHRTVYFIVPRRQASRGSMVCSHKQKPTTSNDISRECETMSSWKSDTTTKIEAKSWSKVLNHSDNKSPQLDRGPTPLAYPCTNAQVEATIILKF